MQWSHRYNCFCFELVTLKGTLAFFPKVSLRFPTIVNLSPDHQRKAPSIFELATPGLQGQCSHPRATEHMSTAWADGVYVASSVFSRRHLKTKWCDSLEVRIVWLICFPLSYNDGQRIGPYLHVLILKEKAANSNKTPLNHLAEHTSQIHCERVSLVDVMKRAPSPQLLPPSWRHLG